MASYNSASGHYMNPEVMTLFRQVADLQPRERADHYARQQVPDALRQEVESLLQFDWSHDSLRDDIESAGRQLLEAPSVRSGGASPNRTRTAPERIGRFEVERLLGRGGMGEVYLARDPVIDRPVAIKLIGNALENETARRRLVREARTAGRLRHPNIVTIFEAGEHEQQPYIAMEFVPGETLRSLIGRREPLPLRRRLEMMEGACAGLAHAHRAGVVHLDIKPDNLMVDDTGVVKVLDFGISRSTQTDTLTVHVAGTLRYMSPEQIQGKAIDHRSDTFSLGTALFELVSYEPAFTGSTSTIVTQIANGPVPRLAERLPGVHPELERIVSRAMALDPEGRYADLDELRHELAAVRAAIDPADDPAAAPRPVPALVERPASASRSAVAARGWGPWTLVAAAAIAALAIAGVVLSFRGEPPAASPARDIAAPAPAATPAAGPTPPAAVPAAAASDDVWRLLARGERTAVIARLDAAPDAALARAVVDTVRATVQRARDNARAGAGTDTYRNGDEQMARATRLTSSGRTTEALRALWQAGDLFAKTSPAVSATDSPPPQQPGQAVTPAVGAPAPTAPSSAPAPNVATTPPPSVVPPPPTVTNPPAATVAAQPKPAAAPPSPVPSDTQAVLETLRRFDAAYEAMDIPALLRVYPSFEGVAQLRRTFQTVTRYEQDTNASRVDVAGDAATVQATVARRMTPHVGAPQTNDSAMEIRLRRSGGDWVIVAVSTR